ncbi:MAG: hypothetical protein QMD66_06770 [Actinomycetota bacterium]|jgi:hypothetical protein|nr:hypothetical protein [Actinomycetota bacterium]
MSGLRMIEPDFWYGRKRFRITRRHLAELRRAGGELRNGTKTAGEARGSRQIPEPPGEEIIARKE